MTLISRVLGLARDSAIAAVFGASGATDAFVVAFRIPNLFRRLFAEGAFSQAFVPVLAGYKSTASPEEVKTVLSAVCSALALVLLVIVALGVVAAPYIITLVAPGFGNDPEKSALSASLLRLTFPYLWFISLTALLGGALNTYGRFAIPALTPALLNVAMITCTLWLAPHLPQPVFALGIGVLLGGALQLGLQVLAVWRAGLLPKPTLNFQHPAVSRILRLMGPAVFGVSVAQLNLLVSTFIASFFTAGSLSWLYYADRLMEFPVGLLGVALGTVIMPRLAHHHARVEPELFSKTLDWSLRTVFALTIPAAVGLAVLGPVLLTTLFQYGEFGAHDVTMSAQALMAYAAGLTGLIMVKVLAPAYYARQDTRTPVKIGLISMLVNLLACMVLGWFFQHAGLALAVSLAAFVNSGLLLRGLLMNGVYRAQAGWRAFATQVGLAAAGMGVGLSVALNHFTGWVGWSVLERGGCLALLVAGGAVLYVSLAWVTGLRLIHMAQPEPRL